MNSSEQKRIYGQFFTKEDVWLKKQVKDFIQASDAIVAYDPFAGAGDLLTASAKLGFKKIIIPNQQDNNDKIDGIEVIQIKRLLDAIGACVNKI